MKKVKLFGFTVVISLMLVACTSNDSLIDKYEQACKNNDDVAKLELLQKLEKADLTPEQEKRLTTITLESFSQQEELDFE